MKMSSNDSNVHPDYDPNLRIKDEPGMSTEPSASIAPLIPNLTKAIKTEPGLPTTRLASFLAPRDLTLGANVKLERPKKVFIPNLNVQRNKNKEDQNASNKTEPSPKAGRGRNRDKGKNEKGKDKKRRNDTSNLIQSTGGAFSEGLANNTSTKRFSGGSSFRDRDSSGGGRETSATLERPKLSIPQKVDKVEEAQKLRELLRDDFVDNGVDEDLENIPVSLPMIDEGKLFKTETSQKLNVSKEDEKSISLQNGEAKTCKESKTSHIKETKLPLTVPQVMENKTNTFILMQLPDCLPGLQADDDPRLKPAPAATIENKTDKSKFCTLNTLQEGVLGKIQILRSGKARLLLGGNNLIVDVGSNLSFRQDLIAAKISDDKQSGDLVNLGPVNSTLICSPDWENMLKNLL